MSKLSKKQRTAIRTLHADTFNEGFDMGFGLGKRVAEKEQEAAFTSGLQLASRDEPERSYPIGERERSCVECRTHIPAYLNHLCEKCWRGILKSVVPGPDGRVTYNPKDSSGFPVQTV